MRESAGVRVEDVSECPHCGSGGDVLYEGLRDRYWDAPGTWSFRRCRGCRHLWLDPRPVPEDLGRLYHAYYTHTQSGASRPTSMGLAARRAVIADMGYDGRVDGGRARAMGRLLRVAGPLRESIEREVRQVRGPPRGTLLDIGCGDGSYLASMRALGWAVLGLEPDAAAAAIARERHGLEVVQSPLERHTFPEDRIDAITVNHVIEHLHDPARGLAVCERALRRGGTVVVITPNAESWGHRVFGSAWFHLDPPRHLQLFTPSTLESLATKAGLVVTDLRTSALSALQVHHMSVALREAGRVEDLGEPFRPTLRDRTFQIAEYGMVGVNPGAGEEIVLVATKGVPR